MGVHGLWKILKPAAHPVAIESLSGKVIAIDASIWIYQFLRVVDVARGHEAGGRGSGRTSLAMVVEGVFQRLCKLLYFNIRPVLVFDGPSAPLLKRAALRERRRRNRAAQGNVYKIASKILRNKLALSALQAAQQDQEDRPFLAPPVGPEGPGPLADRLQHNAGDAWSSGSDISDAEAYYLSIEPFSAAYRGLPNELRERVLLAHRQNRSSFSFSLSASSCAAATASEFSRAQLHHVAKKGRLTHELNEMRRNTEAPQRSAVDPRIEYLLVKRPLVALPLGESPFVKNDSFGWTMAGPAQASPTAEAVDASEVFEEVAIPPLPETVADGDDICFSDCASLPDESVSDSLTLSSGVSDFAELAETLRFESTGDIERNAPATRAQQQERVAVAERFRHDSWTPTVHFSTDRGGDGDGLHVSAAPEIGPALGGHRSRLLAAQAGSLVDASEPTAPPGANTRTEPSTLVSEPPSEPEQPHSPIEPGCIDYSALNPAELLEQNRHLYSELDRETHLSAVPNDEIVVALKELCSILGIPVLSSPMEAEAQCAYLNANKWVDGIMTDDSDVLLFGTGLHVYRGTFSKTLQSIECYASQHIESLLGLSVPRLVFLAYLLGSDYSLGVKGVGAVASLELCAAFCRPQVAPEASLARLYDYFCSPSRSFHELMGEGDGEGKEARFSFLESLRNRHGLEFPRDFPDARISQCYASPVVQKNIDPELLVWRLPSIERLMAFLSAKIGYSSSRTGQIMMPILKRYSSPKWRDEKPKDGPRGQTQLTLASMLVKKKEIVLASKRMTRAIQLLKDTQLDGLPLLPSVSGTGPAPRSRAATKKRKKD